MRVGDLDTVQPGVLPYGEPAGGADDFGQRLVAMRQCPRRVDDGNLSVGKLDRCHRVVDIAACGEALVDRDRARGEDTPGRGRTEQPPRAIDVVDAHVEEDPARLRRILDEEAARVVLVGGLRAHEERAADRACLDLLPHVAVARIEAAHVADHDLLPRMFRGLRFHALTIRKIQRERLLREHVLAGLQRGDDLVGVQRRRRHQDDRVESGVCEQLREVGVRGRDAERVARPGEFVGDRAARRDEFRTLHALRKVRRVPFAHAAEAGNPDAKGRCDHPILQANILRSADR